MPLEAPEEELFVIETSNAWGQRLWWAGYVLGWDFNRAVAYDRFTAEATQETIRQLGKSSGGTLTPLAHCNARILLRSLRTVPPGEN